MTNPYYLEPPAQIGFSGGLTSAYLVREIKNAYGDDIPEGVHFTFDNTGEEDEATLLFVHEVETRWRIPIVWLEYHDVFRPEKYNLRTGRRLDHGKRDYISDPGFRIVTYETASRKGEPYDMMLDYYNDYRRACEKDGGILPTPMNRMCTGHLKIRISEAFMRHKAYPFWDSAMGIRADEPDRIAKIRGWVDAKRWEPVLPLVEAGVTKQHVTAFWREQPFTLGISNEEGNCNLCFLKGGPKIYRLLRQDKYRGEIAARWIDRERRTGMNFRSDRANFATMFERAPFLCTSCWKRDALGGQEMCFRCLLQPNQIAPIERDLIDCVCGIGA